MHRGKAQERDHETIAKDYTIKKWQEGEYLYSEFGLH
jgi:hypothetical protein